MEDVNKIIQELADKRKADRQEQYHKAQAEKLARNKAIYAKLQTSIGPLLDIARQVNAVDANKFSICDACDVNTVESYVYIFEEQAGLGHGVYHRFYGTTRGVVMHETSGKFARLNREELSPADAVVAFVDLLADMKSYERSAP